MTTCFLAPDPVQSTFLIPGSTTLGSGVQLFTYTAGSTTKTTVYKDNAAASAHTNPIILDTGGNLPTASTVWIPQGVSVKFVWAPSNDTDPPASPYRTIDNVTGVGDATLVVSEWVSAPTPSFVGPSTFTMSGDQTAQGLADPGRRMRFSQTAGTTYAYILGRSFGGGLTTVSTVPDTVGLDSGLTAASYSLLTATKDSVPLLPGSRALFMDPTDNTKRVALNLSNVSTGVVRTYTVVDTSDTFVMVSAAATTFNKTMVDPVINTSAAGITGTAIATRAAMSTNSNSLIVTPSSFAFHPAVPQAWGTADASGNLSADAYGYLSITDLATGFIKFTMVTSMATTTYCVNANYQINSSVTGQAVYVEVLQDSPPTVSTFVLCLQRSDGVNNVPIDPNRWHVSVLGRKPAS